MKTGQCLRHAYKGHPPYRQFRKGRYTQA